MKCTTKVVDLLKGEAFGFLGFDLRRVRKREGNGYYLHMSPKKKARKAVKAKVRDIIAHGGTTPMRELVKQINATLGGWVHYFRVGNASRAFSEVREDAEMKVRTLLAGRCRPRFPLTHRFEPCQHYLSFRPR
ncbi:MAG: group II intron maturase-specific domain-containing protein [Terriglobia bacterium]